MGVFSCVKIFLRRVLSGVSKISQAMLFFLALIIFYDVLMRYFFNSPTFWALEISEYLLVFLGFAGIAEVQAHKKHIAMRFFYAKFPESVRRWLDTLFDIFLVAFCSLLLWQSLQMSLIAYKYESYSTSLLATPLFIPYSIIPIAALLLLLQGLVDIAEDVVIIARKGAEENR